MSTAAVPAQRRRLRGLRVWSPARSVPWVIALPGIFGLLAFHIAPAIAGAYYSFTNWNGSTKAKWVGLHNYSSILGSSATRDVLWHTLEIAGAMFVGANLLGLGLALGLNRMVKTRSLLRTLFFLPVAASPISIAFTWQYIFQYDGPLNRLLGTLGLHSLEQDWLGDPRWAIWTIVVVLIWQFSGLTMVVYLAGLQSIPDELIEASVVDGASQWTRLRRLVLPLLLPAIAINGTITIVFGLRIFDQVLGLTGGGPVEATQTLATQVWTDAFSYGEFGYGAAFSLILAALVILVSGIQLLALRRLEDRSL